MGVERVKWDVVEPLVLAAVRENKPLKDMPTIAGVSINAVYYHAKHNPVFELKYANAKLERNKKRSICEYDCFNCPHPDCIR